MSTFTPRPSRPERWSLRWWLLLLEDVWTLPLFLTPLLDDGRRLIGRMPWHGRVPGVAVLILAHLAIMPVIHVIALTRLLWRRLPPAPPWPPPDSMSIEAPPPDDEAD